MKWKLKNGTEITFCESDEDEYQGLDLDLIEYEPEDDDDRTSKEVNEMKRKTKIGEKRRTSNPTKWTLQREQSIIKKRNRGWTFQEIADFFGMQKSQACYVYQRGLKR